ncbi:MAG: hypothetical protein CMN73_16870 [Sphingomonas sp.]|nr:hypothetical protein [Sphingomonas sp.]|tara:strand:+ start:480 stop:806 length:327 start_codon:yes stop_codon:yes gene_type:complete
MTKLMLRTAPLALVAALSLAGCSVKTEDVVEPDNNTGEVVETINYDTPMANFVEPEEEPVAEPTATATPSAAPVGNTTTGLREDEMMLDDAAATGMTSRVDRSEAPAH